ncbi:hypothetical protein ACO0LM_22830 [Undibacterium sp. Di26W]|uniref:hypothetical protein n=1 Tax=Undibacterium sp. Di26W TaxID=3413035 RepID=UPI003BF3826B
MPSPHPVAPWLATPSTKPSLTPKSTPSIPAISAVVALLQKHDNAGMAAWLCHRFEQVAVLPGKAVIGCLRALNAMDCLVFRVVQPMSVCHGNTCQIIILGNFLIGLGKQLLRQPG